MVDDGTAATDEGIGGDGDGTVASDTGDAADDDDDDDDDGAAAAVVVDGDGAGLGFGATSIIVDGGTNLVIASLVGNNGRTAANTLMIDVTYVISTTISSFSDMDDGDGNGVANGVNNVTMCDQ